MPRTPSARTPKKMPEPPPSSPRSSSALVGIFALLIVLLLGFVAARNFSPSRMKSQDKPDAQLTLAQKVAKHILVAAGEEPTVATVEDPDELRSRNPSFYKEASAGDRVLVWSDKAVLYSESRDVILAVLPIVSGQEMQEPGVRTASATSTSSVDNSVQTDISIEVRNGTRTAGLAGKLSQKLEEMGFEVLRPRDAVNRTYAQTIIVDISGKTSTSTMDNLIAATSGTRGVIPQGELAAEGDVLIVVGASYTP